MFKVFCATSCQSTYLDHDSLFSLSCHDVECAVLSQCPMPRLTPEDKYHPVFTAVGCVRLMQHKMTDPGSYALLGGLNRNLAQLKSDPEIVENMSAVKSLLEPYQYPACDIEESYSLVRLYGYTLSDVEDSKVRLRHYLIKSLSDCLSR